MASGDPGRRLAGLVLLAALACGCGAPRTTATLTGVVSIDGQPVDNGSIGFYPVPHEGRRAARSAGSTIDKEGGYRAEILPGRFRVEISSSRVVGRRKTYPDMADSPLEEILEERIPAAYNSATKLSADIVLETTRLDFELESKPRPAK